jgi:transposase
VKEWVVIHKIKALHDNGQGLSIRAISQALKLSRNTVRKYLRMEEVEISARLEECSRTKLLDRHRGYIGYLLETYPKLSAVKVARKLRQKVGELPVSERSLRRYVRAMKQDMATAQVRYYEPILDDVPGVQCQVDPGELRGVMIGDEARTLYFVVFVLSFSRLMYVGLSFRPLNTETFIQLHDEAFRYFGGRPEECVYDQTKLVVIDEQYRELKLNPRFHQYATAAGFRIHACEGYDPESKGKVEAGVKYAKQDCFYGEAFEHPDAVQEQVRTWLEEVANVRFHGTTGERPRERFEAQEREHLVPYLTPACLHRAVAGATRQVDKTGLISWKANKYSVPMAWQQARVGVSEAAEELVISDLESGDVIARHPRCPDKGRILKNTHHYRDHAQRVADLEQGIAALVGLAPGAALCAQLKRSEPKIYKDQLVATRDLLRAHSPVDPALTEQLAQRRGLTATRLKQYLEASQRAAARGREADTEAAISLTATVLDLTAYATIGRSGGQEVTHEPA